MNIFITGTDTGVGKTFLSATLASALVERGIRTGVMKPVETGCRLKNGLLLPADAAALQKAACSDEPLDIINPYRFAPALSPHLAARLCGAKIEMKKIKRSFEIIKNHNDCVIVEGAGGLMTPVTEKKTMADLALLCGAPLIIVAVSRLGILNHTLLTISAAKTKGLAVKAIVLNDLKPGKSDASLAHNRSELERLTRLPVYALPYSSRKKARPLAGAGLDGFIESFLP